LGQIVRLATFGGGKNWGGGLFEWNVHGKIQGNAQITTRDYKRLRAAFMTCATLVDTHTNTHRQTVFDQLYY